MEISWICYWICRYTICKR